MKEPTDIIQTICLTEKASRLMETQNTYVFRCIPRATKPEIKAAVESLFKTKVVGVNTLNVRGKARRKRTLQAGTTSAWKKAYVKLAPGERIDVA
jgi:large subunit ribosomal protein L23